MKRTSFILLLCFLCQWSLAQLTGLLKYSEYATFDAKPDTTAGPFANATHTGLLTYLDWNSFHNFVTATIDSSRSYAASPMMKPPNTPGKYDDEFNGGWLDTVKTWHWFNRGRLLDFPQDSTRLSVDSGVKAFLICGNLYMQESPPTGVDSLRCLFRRLNTAVDTCFSITVQMTFLSSTVGGHPNGGIFLMDSTSGRLVTIGAQEQGGTVGIGGNKWTSATLLSTQYYYQGLALDVCRGRGWYRLMRKRPDLPAGQQNVNTWSAQYSADGTTWRTIFSEALSTFIESSGQIDRIGVYTDQNTVGGAEAQALFSWFRYNWVPDYNPLVNK